MSNWWLRPTHAPSVPTMRPATWLCPWVAASLTLLLLAQVHADATIANSCIKPPTSQGTLVVGDNLTDTSNVLVYTSALASSSCVYFTISSATTACALDPNSMIMVEWWRLKQDSSHSWVEVVTDDQPPINIFLLAARGMMPQVQTNSDLLPVYDPNLATSTSAGAYNDEDGWNYQRPVMRLFLPQNSSALAGSSNSWYILLANLNPIGTPLAGYKLRATCLPSNATIPCAATIAGGPQCSGQGSCVPNTGYVDQAGDQVYCNCTAGYGGWACERAVPAIGNSAIGTIPPYGLTLTPGQWQYFQFDVPATSRDYEILVGMNRGQPGGDPVLFLKPANAPDHGLPFLDMNDTDISTYGDVWGFTREENYQYLMHRYRAPSAGAPETLPSRWYIGIANTKYRGLNSVATVTLTAEWGSPEVTSLFCPNNCGGRGIGQCVDPSQAGPSVLQATPSQSSALLSGDYSTDFLCSCSTPYGGMLCDGLQGVLRVGSSIGTNVQDTLQPGGWHYYLVQFDSSFNPQQSDFAVQWTVSSSSPTDQHSNAWLAASQGAYPRAVAQLSEGAVVTKNYFLLQSSSDGPLPLLGSDLFPGNSLNLGSQYILGVHNSNLLYGLNFTYTLTTFVPSSGPSYIAPYMSIVLGITAAIILCLLMTLCRRIIQRYGLCCWRRPPPTSSNIQIVPMRPRGVPAHIIATFPTYVYKEGDIERGMELASTAAPRAEVGHATAGEPAPAAAANAGAAGAGAAVGALTRLTNWAQKQVGRGNAPVASDAAGGVAVTAGPPGLAAGGDAPMPGGAPAAATTAARCEEDAPACTVCLCEYQEGEMMLRLPCRHAFHQSCIVKWMSQHNTCPICREPLSPDAQHSEDGDTEGGEPEEEQPPQQARGGRHASPRTRRGQRYSSEATGVGDDQGGLPVGGGAVGPRTPVPNRLSSLGPIPVSTTETDAGSSAWSTAGEAHSTYAGVASSTASASSGPTVQQAGGAVPPAV